MNVSVTHKCDGTHAIPSSSCVWRNYCSAQTAYNYRALSAQHSVYPFNNSLQILIIVFVGQRQP